MRSRGDLGGETALEPAERAVEQWRPELAVPHGDPLPHPDGRDAASEVLCERLLIGREERHGERPRLAQKLVQRRLARDGDTDERGLEREGRERGDGQADALAARVDADHRDTARMAAEDTRGTRRARPRGDSTA